MSGNFDIMFPRIAAKRVSNAIRGMGKAVTQALTDATTEIPATPHLTGQLRGSGSAFVNNKVVAQNQDISGKGTPATTHTESLPSEQIVGLVGFNTVYAHRMHEGVGFHFKTAGTGAKFLETKFLTNRDVYYQIISSEVQKP